MAKKNFGNLVDNAKEEITQRKIERESIHQLQKQINELEERMGQTNQESAPSETPVQQNPTMQQQQPSATVQQPSIMVQQQQSVMVQQPAVEDRLTEPEDVKKTFRIYAHLNTAFNIACAKRGIGKGTLLNQLIEEWLKANGEL